MEKYLNEPITKRPVSARRAILDASLRRCGGGHTLLICPEHSSEVFAPEAPATPTPSMRLTRSFAIGSNTKKTTLFSLFIFSISITFMSCSTYYHAYQPTPSGVFEEKEIPELYVLETTASGIYESNANKMFRKLFNYINENKIKMTVPVEADFASTNPNMRFFLSPELSPENLKETQEVKIRQIPPKLVVSFGSRGSYSTSNVNEAYAQLEDWLKKQPIYQKAGNPYAIFWDSPFKLWFLKRFEIHIPVARIANPEQNLSK